jgi:hypothetical protein
MGPFKTDCLRLKLTLEELTVHVNNAAETIRQNSDIFYGPKGTRACIDNGGRHFDYLEVCALDQV